MFGIRFTRIAASCMAVLVLSSQLVAAIPARCGCSDDPTVTVQSCCSTATKPESKSSCCADEAGCLCGDSCGQNATDCACGCTPEEGKNQVPIKDAANGPRLSEEVVAATSLSTATCVHKKCNARHVLARSASLAEADSLQILFGVWRI